MERRGGGACKKRGMMSRETTLEMQLPCEREQVPVSVLRNGGVNLNEPTVCWSALLLLPWHSPPRLPSRTDGRGNKHSAG